jgi:peptidoglycan/xylan/chitin deacetylase (PgdA/CDA1 family)
VAEWPGGARGALCLSFDNLGEAAEIELGALAPEDPTVGEHPTATRVLPSLLDALGERGLSATFFVEGLNAELYPEALRAIAAAGHEVAYHAWRHEQWGELSAAEQAENLARGVTAFEALDLSVAGLRPPGGQLGDGGLDVLREAGLRYCSPAGEGVGVNGSFAFIPFQWRHVDATSMLPGLDPVREQMTGSPNPLDARTFVAYIEREIGAIEQQGGFMSIVLHLPMLDWLGEDNLPTILDKLSSTQLWLARCDEVAEHIFASSELFEDGTTLDSTTWT